MQEHDGLRLPVAEHLPFLYNLSLSQLVFRSEERAGAVMRKGERNAGSIATAGTLAAHRCAGRPEIAALSGRCCSLLAGVNIDVGTVCRHPNRCSLSMIQDTFEPESWEDIR